MKIGSKIPASLELEDMKNKKKLEKAAIELQFAVRQREKGKTREGYGTINMRERERETRKKEMRIGWCQAGRQAGRRRYLVELLLWGSEVRL